MGLIMAGIMVGTAIYGAVKANEADQEAADIEKYQNLIDLAGFERDVSMQQYNLSIEAGTALSSQVATAAAMGKRADVGSTQKIIDVTAENYQRDIETLGKDLARAKATGKVTNEAIDKLTESKQKQRNIQVASQGLLSIAKVFADT